MTAKSTTIPVAFGNAVRRVRKSMHLPACAPTREAARVLTCDAGNNRVSIEVRDDGQDLSELELDTLFEPYTRAHQAASPNRSDSASPSPATSPKP